MPAALYTADNCKFAYQLTWSLSVFANAALPSSSNWLPQLKVAVEADDVRILEHRLKSDNVHQFLLSTKPHVAPSSGIRSVKGRLQHLVRDRLPRAFRRNYHLQSVGSTKREGVQNYVLSQLSHHRMVDERVQRRLEKLQINNSAINLSEVRHSSHGQFVHNLHVVLVHQDRWNEVHEQSLQRIYEMLNRASAHHGHLLSCAGMLSDHIHLALGCHVDESPAEVALSYLNNLAFVQGMKPNYQFGAYLGTFGDYDLGAIWNTLASG